MMFPCQHEPRLPHLEIDDLHLRADSLARSLAFDQSDAFRQATAMLAHLCAVVEHQAVELRECRLQLGLEIPKPLKGANQ